MAHLNWEWSLSHARLRDLLSSGSAANLSIDLTAGPISPTVDSHYHHFMQACPYGEQTTRQNETYTQTSNLSSPPTDSKQEGGHGWALNHLFTVWEWPSFDASGSILNQQISQDSWKVCWFQKFYPKFSSNVFAKIWTRGPCWLGSVTSI